MARAGSGSTSGIRFFHTLWEGVFFLIFLQYFLQDTHVESLLFFCMSLYLGSAVFHLVTLQTGPAFSSFISLQGERLSIVVLVLSVSPFFFFFFFSYSPSVHDIIIMDLIVITMLDPSI